MKIEIIKVGELKCNCYILTIRDYVLIIDPGDDSEKIIKSIGNKKVVGIIITHHHFDHVGAVSKLMAKYNVSVYDRYNLDEGKNHIYCFSFEIIYTPGHSDDSITIYFRHEKIMFVGDFIFKDSIGRCDLPTGNLKKMFNSINKIKTYDKDIMLYPGHGARTTLGYEINNNVYFKSNLL